MSETKSLADMAVETLAAVSCMDSMTGNDHAERHTIRALKRTAETIIENAFRQAMGLAYAAEDLRELHRKLEK